MRIQTRWKTLTDLEETAEFCRDLELNILEVREKIFYLNEYNNCKNIFRRRHLRHYFEYGNFEGYRKSLLERILIKLKK